MKTAKSICILLLLLLSFATFSCGEIKVSGTDNIAGSDKNLVQESQKLLVAASNDGFVTLLVSSVTLTGSASSGNGSILSYLWEKL